MVFKSRQAVENIARESQELQLDLKDRDEATIRMLDISRIIRPSWIDRSDNAETETLSPMNVKNLRKGKIVSRKACIPITVSRRARRTDNSQTPFRPAYSESHTAATIRCSSLLKSR